MEEMECGRDVWCGVHNGTCGIDNDEDDEDDEDDEGVSYAQRYEELKQKNIKDIKDKLSKYGWVMLAIDDEDYLFKYSNSDGEVGFGDIDLGKDLLNKLRG